MKKKPDEEHFIPIIDCPHCKAKRQPLSTLGPWMKGSIEVFVSFCPACNKVPADESCIKGYVSIKELAKMGWKKLDEKEAERVLDEAYEGNESTDRG